MKPTNTRIDHDPYTSVDSNVLDGMPLGEHVFTEADAARTRELGATVEPTPAETQELLLLRVKEHIWRDS